MKRTVKKMVACIMSFVILLTHVPTAFASNANNVSKLSETTEVLVYQDNAVVVMASVPASVADEYQEKLQHNEAFMEQQIQVALSAIENNSSTSATTYGYDLPEGNILHDERMYLSDIADWVDRQNQPGSFALKLAELGVSTVGLDKLISWMCSACNIKIPVGVVGALAFTASFFGILISQAQEESNAWWTNALKSVINESKSYVRYVIVENTKSDYPKAWRIFQLV